MIPVDGPRVRHLHAIKLNPSSRSDKLGKKNKHFQDTFMMLQKK